MAATSWVIRRSKRETPATESRPRKRRRLSNDDDAATRKRQSTLTQIQFVHTPSLETEDGDGLKEISLQSGRRSTSRSASTKSRRSRSTLTQMDWLNMPKIKSELSDGDMLPVRDGDGIEGISRNKIQQMDGPHESPPFRARRISPSERRIVIPDSDEEECNYRDGASQPENREPSTIRRRKQSPSLSSTPSKREPHKREIQDTYVRDDAGIDDNEEAEALSPYPQTPRKVKLEEIPSSQTPQSKARTTRRIRFYDLNNSSKSPLRHPLQDRSVNIQSAQLHDVKVPTTMSSTPKRPLGKKVCVLKSPVNPILAKPVQIEDSQEDVDSIQTSSQPLSKQCTQAWPARAGPSRSSSVSGVVEIPPSSQYDQTCLPEPDDKSIGSSRSGELEIELEARDSDAEDSDCDLGSPVANDTQFNQALLQRTSSPFSVSQKVISDVDDEGEIGCNKASTVHYTAAEELDLRPESIRSGMDNDMPTPTLVRSQVAELNATADADGTAIQSTNSRNQTHNILTAQVVTAIAANENSSSPTMSAPVLPSQWYTQRSAHPAALPHPSQMSTQDPTQAFGLSSMPPMPPGNNTIFTQGVSAEVVTVKDSSSVNDQLDQIPEHIGESQPVGLRLVEDSDEEIDDLDLDPGSPSRNSARKTLYKKIGKSQHRQRRAKQCIGQSSNFSSSPLAKVQRGSSPDLEDVQAYDDTPRPTGRTRAEELSSLQALLNTISSSPSPPPANSGYIRRPIPGFNNETQSNFTQHGHISAAYIHRQREAGILPESYVPPRLQVADSDDDEDESSEL